MQRIVANPAEERAVRDALVASGGNISRAAHELGATRKTVRLRMQTYHLGHGQPGRPRKALSVAKKLFAGDENTVMAIAAVGLVGATIWWLLRRKKPTNVAVMGADALRAADAAMASGFDVLGAI